jgi:hypothetical protein
MTTPEPTPESNPLCGADPLARALAKLRPAPAGMDANRLLFEAGQVARDRDVAFWRRVSLAQFALMATFGCVAAVLVVKLATTPPQVQIVRVEIEVPQKPEEAPSPRIAPETPSVYPPAGGYAGKTPDPDALAEYLRIRHDVLTAGLGLLPDHKPRPTAPASADELERSLNLPPGVLAIPQWQPRKPRPEPEPDSP